MNAQKIKGVVDKLRDAISGGTDVLRARGWASPNHGFEQVYRELNQCRLEMQAMEAKEPHCRRCDATLHDGNETLCPACTERAQSVDGDELSRQFSTIEKRLRTQVGRVNNLSNEGSELARKVEAIEKRLDETLNRELYPSFVPPNQPPEEPVYAEQPAPPDLPRREADDPTHSGRNAAAIALIEKWLADPTGYDEDVWPRLKAHLNPPPIEIEMQAIPPPWPEAGWTWITQLAGLHLHGSQGWPCEYFESRKDLVEAGDTWVAAVGDKLGVPLVANWEKPCPPPASG